MQATKSLLPVSPREGYSSDMTDSSSPSETPQPQGISLDKLSQAYAQALGPDVAPPQTDETESDTSEDVAEGGDVGQEGADTLPIAEAEVEPDADEPGDHVPVSPQTVLEAMLFVGSLDNQPLPAVKAAELMRGVTPGEIVALVDQLNARYRSNGCPYKIVGDGAGFRMTLRTVFHAVRNKFYGRVREAKLSQAAIDTLAIVAYRQPLTSETVSQLRGTPSGHLLTQLVRRQLLTAERLEDSRRMQYRTTDRFLELFGLESLEELPDSEE